MSAWTVALVAVCYAGAALVRLGVAAPVGYWLPVLAEGVLLSNKQSAVVIIPDENLRNQVRAWLEADVVAPYP